MQRGGMKEFLELNFNIVMDNFFATKLSKRQTVIHGYGSTVFTHQKSRLGTTHKTREEIAHIILQMI